jgi:hypothetical protein
MAESVEQAVEQALAYAKHRDLHDKLIPLDEWDEDEHSAEHEHVGYIIYMYGNPEFKGGENYEKEIREALIKEFPNHFE